MKGQYQLLDDKLEFFMSQHSMAPAISSRMGPSATGQTKVVSAWFQQGLHIQLVKWPGNWEGGMSRN
jgi:hypothetical protein